MFKRSQQHMVILTGHSNILTVEFLKCNLVWEPVQVECHQEWVEIQWLAWINQETMVMRVKIQEQMLD